MRIILILAISVLLFSCATQVTSLKEDQDKVIGKEKGYLLLGIQTNRDLKGIEISGPQNIKLSSSDIKEGTNYLLVDLEAGVYTIDRVFLDKYWRVSLDNEEYWQFKVTAGQISYVGHLEIVRRGYWAGVTNAELVNRSSEAIQFLEEKYPNIYANRKISYGGPGSDYFFDFLESSEKE